MAKLYKVCMAEECDNKISPVSEPNLCFECYLQWLSEYEPEVVNDE